MLYFCENFLTIMKKYPKDKNPRVHNRECKLNLLGEQSIEKAEDIILRVTVRRVYLFVRLLLKTSLNLDLKQSGTFKIKPAADLGVGTSHQQTIKKDIFLLLL